jgi:hypothetical protein
VTKDLWVPRFFITNIIFLQKLGLVSSLILCTITHSNWLFISIKNRPVLVLKCDQGFVGYKSATSTRLECNKATYETIVVERTDKGMVHLKGKYPSFIYSWAIRHIWKHKFNIYRQIVFSVLQKHPSCYVYFHGQNKSKNRFVCKTEEQVYKPTVYKTGFNTYFYQKQTLWFIDRHACFEYWVNWRVKINPKLNVGQ